MSSPLVVVAGICPLLDEEVEAMLAERQPPEDEEEEEEEEEEDEDEDEDVDEETRTTPLIPTATWTSQM